MLLQESSKNSSEKFTLQILSSIIEELQDLVERVILEASTGKSNQKMN